MNDYTLKLFKLTHLNINIEKSFEKIIKEDETTLDIYLNLSTFIFPHYNLKDIKIVSSVTSQINYTIFVDHKTTIYIEENFNVWLVRKSF